jgi:hypothetical protein
MPDKLLWCVCGHQFYLHELVGGDAAPAECAGCVGEPAPCEYFSPDIKRNAEAGDPRGKIRGARGALNRWHRRRVERLLKA